MVEKVNDTIKLNTLKIHTYENILDMKTDLNWFLVDYNLTRRHSSLRTKIWVKTPFEAIDYWFKLSPDFFKETPFEFKQKLLTMKKNL